VVVCPNVTSSSHSSSDLSYVSPPGLAAPQLIFGHGLGHQLPPTAAYIALSGSRPIHICPCRRSCPRRYGNYGSDGWSPADGFPPPSPGEQRPCWRPSGTSCAG